MTQEEWEKAWTLAIGLWPDAGTGAPKTLEQEEVEAWDHYLEEPRCFHEWKEYVGFSEKYKFCHFCDKKEPTNE